MSMASCPGCIAAGPIAEAAGRNAGLPTHELILPGVHCVACIRSVEGLLNARADIAAARVNLSRKRVAITAEPGWTRPHGLLRWPISGSRRMRPAMLAVARRRMA